MIYTFACLAFVVLLQMKSSTLTCRNNLNLRPRPPSKLYQCISSLHIWDDKHCSEVMIAWYLEFQWYWITLIFDGLKMGKVFKSNTWPGICAALNTYILQNMPGPRTGTLPGQVLNMKTLPIFSPLKISVNYCCSRHKSSISIEWSWSIYLFYVLDFEMWYVN